MSNIVIHRPSLLGSRYVGQIDFSVRGFPVTLSVAIDQRAIEALVSRGMDFLSAHGVTFAGKGKSCCSSCARGGGCADKRPAAFGARLRDDAAEVGYLLEQNNELVDALEWRKSSLPPEVAIYEDVLLAAADPYQQEELEGWFWGLRAEASTGDILAQSLLSSLNELATLDGLRKSYLMADQLATWQVENLEAVRHFDPEAERLWELWGALGAVSTFPLAATYNLGDMAATPVVAQRFGKSLSQKARAGGVKDTFTSILHKARRRGRSHFGGCLNAYLGTPYD